MTYITMPLKWCYRMDHHESYFLNANRDEIIFLTNSKYLLPLKIFTTKGDSFLGEHLHKISLNNHGKTQVSNTKTQNNMFIPISWTTFWSCDYTNGQLCRYQLTKCLSNFLETNGKYNSLSWKEFLLYSKLPKEFCGIFCVVSMQWKNLKSTLKQKNW